MSVTFVTEFIDAGGSGASSQTIFWHFSADHKTNPCHHHLVGSSEHRHIHCVERNRSAGQLFLRQNISEKSRCFWRRQLGLKRIALCDVALHIQVRQLLGKPKLRRNYVLAGALPTICLKCYLTAFQ